MNKSFGGERSKTMNKKKCRVCGDITLVHFNFNGLSCQSCKKFFRRSCDKKFRCTRSRNCLIDKSTRKSCKYCRLQRCFSAGMRKELILGGAVLDLAKSDESPQQAKPADFDERAPKPAPITCSASILEPYERSLIAEVQAGMSAFVDEHRLEVIGAAQPEEHLVTVVNLPHLYVKKVINFCKNLSPFTKLGAADQLTLLKWFFPSISAVYAAHLYCVEQDGFKILADESHARTLFVKTDFNQQHMKKNSISALRCFTYSLQIEIASDTVIRDLIIAQVLFRKTEDMSCPEFIRYHYLVYCHLLWRYLQQKFADEGRAERKFAAIMQILDQMDSISELIRDLYNDVDKSQISHILAEIYNLL